MYGVSTAREGLGEAPNRRRVIQTTREGTTTTTTSARNYGILRRRNTGAVTPSRASLTRPQAISPSRSKGFISTARLPTKSTNMTSTLATPLRSSTARRSLSLASPAAKSPVFTPRYARSPAACNNNSSARNSISTKPLHLLSSRSHQSDSGIAITESPVARQDREENILGSSVPFSITGPYVRVAVVSGSAALWAANGESGTIDVFSIVSGKLLTQIAARLTASGEIAKPVALMATQHHLWAGFDDGMVVIYDHLCVTQLTMGLFHSAPIVDFCVMANGITISGSVDMALVRWDREEKNFEAIARIVGVSEAHQALTCMAALAADIVLCGSMSGNVVAVDCASGMQVATLRGHSKRVNALVVIGDLIFSASEDCFVNVWSLKVTESSSDIPLQRTCKLLNRIFVQAVVCELVPHHSAHSLLVAYTDGLVELWSASPDDDFAVEQVVRKSFVDSKDSNKDDDKQTELLSLSSIGTVETMRVLALGSGGISKVWCGHRNVLEDLLTESITALNAVITQDSAEAFAWEQKALALKQKEKKRKNGYSLLLFRLTTRWLLSRYYKKWKSQIKFPGMREKQERVICLALKNFHELRLMRCYFTRWYCSYDLEQRRCMRSLIVSRLERLSQHILLVRAISKWREMVTHRKELRQKEEIGNVLLKLSNGVLLEKFFTYWRFLGGMRSRKLPSEKISLLVRKSQQKFLQHFYQLWLSTYKQKKMSRKNGENVSANTANALAARPVSQIALFAEAYAKVTKERMRRNTFSMWRRWSERRHNLCSLRLFAVAAERRCHLNMMYRALVTWQLFLREKSLDKKALEVQEVERCLREAEETHADIVDKLQLQKRLDHLRRQHEEEQRQLQEGNEQVQKLLSNFETLRQSLGYSSALRGTGSNDDIVENASNMFFSPGVLQQMPVGEAMALVMMRLKGTVVNIFTDMSLFRQIRDRIRSGTTAAIVFLEGFQEVKRALVNLAKKTSTGAWRNGERWPLTVDLLEDLPLHVCNTILQSIKAMAVSYDMVSSAEIETISLTRAEILANADFLFFLWRVAYAARRPSLPENKRVSSTRQHN